MLNSMTNIIFSKTLLILIHRSIGQITYSKNAINCITKTGGINGGEGGVGIKKEGERKIEKQKFCKE